MKLTPVTSFSEIPPIVLFVGEDTDALPSYSAHLQHAGMWVASSTRPIEALLTVQELQPDVIVADVDFAEGSPGLAFVDGLALSDATLAIPLIALTSDGSHDVPRSARVRTTLWVPKPVVPDVLVANVQQLLVEGYAVRMRADRENKRLHDLAERSRGLLSNSAEADRFASATRTCPTCAHPLQWIENGRIGTVRYDYYQWCAHGCGLHCYDLDGQVWVKLAPVDDGRLANLPTQEPPRVVETVTASVSAVSIETDRAGYITAIDPAGAKLINYSARHAVGTSLLPFVQQGRQQLIEDLRRVGDVEFPARAVVWWPRDRKPRRALVSVRAMAEGIRWTITAEPVAPIRPRRGRARTR
jgi:CheY-like chemotaxis protein